MVKLVRKLPGGKSKKVRVSERFELLRVRVWDSTVVIIIQSRKGGKSPYSTLSTLQILEPSNWPCSSRVLEAQWIERPPSVCARSWGSCILESRRRLGFSLCPTPVT